MRIRDWSSDVCSSDLPLPLYCNSLKDAQSAEVVRSLLAGSKAQIVLNCTGFALSAPGAARAETPFDACDGPVLQVVFSGGTAKAWEEGTAGLSARDIAMNVALPEVDGRLLTRAVSFKGAARWAAATQTSLVAYEPVADRIAFVAHHARHLLRLRRNRNSSVS